MMLEQHVNCLTICTVCTLDERKQEEVSKWIRALSLLYSQAYSTQKPHVMKRFHREKYTMPYYGGHMECTFLTENVPLHVAFVCFRLVNKVIGIFLAISNIVWELNQSLIIITLSGMFWVVQCTIVHCINISLGPCEISWWFGDCTNQSSLSYQQCTDTVLKAHNQ